MGFVQKIILVTFILLTLRLTCTCQEYKSVLIPSELNNNPVDLNLYNNTFIIKSLNFFPSGIGGSILYRVDLNLNPQSVHEYEGIIFARKSPLEVNGRLFAFGSDNIVEGKYNMIEFDSDLNEFSSYDYTSIYTDGGAVGTCIFGEKLLGLVWDNEDCTGCKSQMQIKQIDIAGSEEILGNYFEDLKRSFSNSIIPTSDGNILFAGVQEFEGLIGSTAIATKINKEGNVLWRYIGNDFQVAPNIAVFTSELSDGNIVFTDQVRRFEDWEFTSNGYNLRPWKLQWLTPTGDSLMEYVHKDISVNQSTINGIVTGKQGGYFFIYGTYNTINDPVPPQGNYGFIRKLANNGDIIWDRKYHHKDIDINAYHSITDIEEIENGDIVTLGLLSGPEKLEMWMMRLNAEGCFGESQCGEENIYTNTTNIFSYNQNLKLYPNPSNEQFSIIGIEDRVVKIEMLTLTGQSILILEGFDIHHVDTNSLRHGIYIVNITTSKGQIFSTKSVIGL